MLNILKDSEKSWRRIAKLATPLDAKKPVILGTKVKSGGDFEAYTDDVKIYINIDEAKFKISIEAASTDCWKKYIGTEGLAFGIDTFGKSAPYKEIYKYFGLTVQNISQKTKKLIKS